MSVLVQQMERERQQSLLLISQVLEDKVRIAQLTEQLQTLLSPQVPQPVDVPAVTPPAAEPQSDDPKAIRKAKILKYKAKLQRRREKVGITRACPGRKDAAKMRARMQGKFAKMA